MTRDWRVVALLAGAIALVVIGVVLLTHHAELKPAPKLVKYYSTILPSEDVAQQKLRQYQARIEQAGGTITIQTLALYTVSSTLVSSSTTAGTQPTETRTTRTGPALVVSLPEGVDIYALLPDAKDLAFQSFP
jgi:hypothetical protein